MRELDASAVLAFILVPLLLWLAVVGFAVFGFGLAPDAGVPDARLEAACERRAG